MHSPLVIAPGDSAAMKVKADNVISAPVLTYVNEYGAPLPLVSAPAR
ncbi:hypothetical protein ABC356_002662 [Salmonella enterica]|uniref:Uncharacterized protein n=1 Tax=Salmonella diarizonae TaxID=59204 RepID=A0A8F5N144_SALDZ|nr:hypothetical protein [Salmonella enterica]EHJ8503352.1 hypothetical protein [Salmonella enterica subsp. diarizonae serovar 47:k:z53:[z84]]EHL1810458.1 hypothetical protein [Salmonella enterica subsp. diarizonae]EHN1753609.1 hypothetical protein [Salmonella enterica subsp. diarizonae serovar 50:z52:z35]EHQ9196876.1 hypothetical protein [Salmonella enterica subsp. diarizonae serovar 50:k:z:[z50],[z57],[z68], [z86]]EIE2747346.1 hypothetical protein [Salmonella enterica subsp. diarizonae serova